MRTSSSDDDAADGTDAVEAKLKKMGLDPEKERQMRIKMKAEEAARLYKEQRRKEAEEMRQRGEPLDDTARRSGGGGSKEAKGLEGGPSTTSTRSGGAKRTRRPRH